MNDHYKFINPPLPYEYDALEPFIDEKTMHLHHDRHLQTYVDNLNNVLKDFPEYQNVSIENLLRYSSSLPLSIRTPVRNNAGGVYNHIFYFFNLQNSNQSLLPNPLASYITTNFGSYNTFQQKFTNAALSVFGSGYAWLVLNTSGNLSIITTANQDTPLPLGLCPILNVDVWEHAYYLKHYNMRADYIKDWFQVINWDHVNQHLMNCLNYGHD